MSKELELHPSLAEVAQKASVDGKRLVVDLPLNELGRLEIKDRSQIIVTDGAVRMTWHVPSIRALFRGDATPPSFTGQPPSEYMPHFKFVESHVIKFCSKAGRKTDGEFEEAFSNLRRRPDGKPLSDLHGFLWQTAAVLLGLYPLSAAEFDGIFGRLAISASTFRTGLVSRNYIEVLEHTFF